MKKRIQKYDQVVPNAHMQNVCSLPVRLPNVRNMIRARAVHIYTYSKLTALKSVNLSMVKSMEQEESTAIKSVNLTVVKSIVIG